MLKHIKLFESFNLTDQDIANTIYEEWKSSLPSDIISLIEGKVNESDYFEEESELTPGEMRALAREMQIISKPQLAALYLFALGKAEDDSYKYILRIPGMLDFANTDNSGNPTITYAAFADAIGAESLTTVSRTINKFRNLIDGVGETPGEVVYPKVIQAYDAFKSMNTDTLASEAGETIQDSTSSMKNREAALASSAKGAESRAEEKKKAEKFGAEIYRLINQLRANPKFSDLKKAQSFAVNIISSDSKIPTNKLLGYYETYLKSKGIFNSLYYA
jgi:hypothetical protein